MDVQDDTAQGVLRVAVVQACRPRDGVVADEVVVRVPRKTETKRQRQRQRQRERERERDGKREGRRERERQRTKTVHSQLRSSEALRRKFRHLTQADRRTERAILAHAPKHIKHMFSHSLTSGHTQYPS